MDLWATTSRYHCATTSRETTQQERLTPKWDYSRTLETQTAPDLLLTLRWWFWCGNVGKHHTEHLVSVLREYYKISHDWKGKKYLGIDLDWYYSHRKVHLSMMSCVIDSLTIFQHNNLQKPQHQPYPHIWTNHGAKAQYAEAAEVSPPLSIADKNLYKKSRIIFYIMRRQLILLCWQHLDPSQHRNKIQRSTRCKKWNNY